MPYKKQSKGAARQPPHRINPKEKSMHSATSNVKPDCQIVLNITVDAEFPDDKSLFITGNLPELGNWDPAGTELKPQSPGKYEIKLATPVGSIIECKVTRGSWKTQGIYTPNDIPPSNLVIKAQKNTTVPVKIIDWLDLQVKEADPVTGKLVNIESLEAKGLKYQRPIQVWLPESYSETSQPHAVIYMHDGQNLFDPAAAFAGVDWKVDETVTELIKTGQMRPSIVVGIPNSPDRMQELNLYTSAGKHYTRFVAEVVKPYIDKNFNVLTDKNNTVIMGSSMGGLMSFQMAMTLPEIFGGAGCLSSAFGKTDGKIYEFVEKAAFLPEGVKVYLDTGEYEPPIVKAYFHMLKLLKQKGFFEGFNLMGFFDEKATHCEAAWARRLHLPLKFLLRPEI